MAVFWVVVPRNLTEVCRRFRGACCLHHLGDEWVSERSEMQLPKSDSRSEFPRSHGGKHVATVCWAVAPCSLVKFIDVSEVRAAPIIIAISLMTRRSKHLWNVGKTSTTQHGATMQKTAICTLAAVRTWNLTKHLVHWAELREEKTGKVSNYMATQHKQAWPQRVGTFDSRSSIGTNRVTIVCVCVCSPECGEGKDLQVFVKSEAPRDTACNSQPAQNPTAQCESSWGKQCSVIDRGEEVVAACEEAKSAGKLSTKFLPFFPLDTCRQRHENPLKIFGSSNVTTF
jgi:hypothetical protein